MSITYIHYGSDKFDSSKFKPITNRYAWNKPLGGLWASRIDDPLGWKQWSEDNGFHEDRLEHSFTFTLKPSANVIEIAKPSDVDLLPRWFAKHRLHREFSKENYIPDFEECVRKGIDAIEITDIDEVYEALYGWDCNSILIMNPEIIVVE